MACLQEQIPNEFFGNGTVRCSEDGCTFLRRKLGDGWVLDEDSPDDACVIYGKKCEAITAGCAECGVADGAPLIETRIFPTVDEAKTYYNELGWLRYGYPSKPPIWKPHPQGGEHVVMSQGSVWLRPL